MNVALRSQHLNIISLCTGGGGLDLGVELAMPSARSVCMVEREAFACGHLVAAMQQGLMGQAPIWSNARTFNGRPWRGIVDGVIGGIPCQPHSLAGKRLGEDDERDLWSAARRIIVQSGAWFALIENVSGMLSSGGAERVFRDFRRMGFEVEGGLFTAAEVGASHERERVFILAVANRYNEHDYGAGIVGPGWRRQFADCSRDVADAGHDGWTSRRAWGEHEQDASISEQSGRHSQTMADASGAGLEGIEPGGYARSRHEGTASERGCSPLVYTGCPERRPHVIARCDGYREDAGRPETASRTREPSRSLADSDDQRQPQPQGSITGIGRWASDVRGLFPPGPSDLQSWRHTLERAPELEPAFRRVADGLASRLDTARVDRLRLLGNGVVSLEGAYAFRTLATRLAASGSLGAIRLVRGMEIAMETA